MVQSMVYLATYDLCSNNQVWLGYWYHWVAESGAGRMRRGGVTFGSFVTFDVEQLSPCKWLVGIFILMPFDVVEGGLNWVTLKGGLSYCHIHITVIRSGIIGSENMILMQFSDIGDDAQVIAEAVNCGSIVLIGLVTGDVIAKE